MKTTKTHRGSTVGDHPIGGSGQYFRTLFDVGVAAGLTDGQLLERFATQRGEAAELAFSALVERHGPMVLRACRGILRDDHGARDAFQATFLVLVRKGRSLWVRDSLGPWLHRVACRAAARVRAEERRRREHERRAAERLGAWTAAGDPDDLAAVLHEELDRLPDRFRVPIVLCDLEGRTCEQAAQHLGCPVGTVGSRLVRGRERLRGRLTRRGLAPAAGSSLATLLASRANGAAVSAALADATVKAAVGTPPAGVAALAHRLYWSLIMSTWKSVAVVVLAAGSLSLGATWTLLPSAGNQARAQAEKKAQADDKARAEKKARIEDEYPFMNDKERLKGAHYIEIGNMRPVVKGPRGFRFQSREGILYKDGTAKLWSLAQKDPLAPIMRHDGPIRELTFFDGASLLITLSDNSVKAWDALTGAPRKELAGQVIRPLWLSYAPSAQRFVTIESDRTSVTVWDATNLDAIRTFRLERAPGVLEAGLSGDGKSVVTFTHGADPAAELWDVASGKSFATLRPPAPAVVEIFAPNGELLIKSRLTESDTDRGTAFWKVVKSLAPADRGPRN